MKAIFFFVGFTLFISAQTNVFAQSIKQTAISKEKKAIPVDNNVPTLKQDPDQDKHATEIKTDDKNRQYLLINNRKVLVDQQGVQSLVNPVHLDSTISKVSITKEKVE